MNATPRRALCSLLCLLWICGAAGVRAESLELRASAVLERVSRDSPELASLIARARAVLVFPEVVPMTFGEGGQYGEGALLISGAAVARYASTGPQRPIFPVGVLHRTDVLLFMTDQALWDFRNRPVWRLGLDGQVRELEHGRPGRWPGTLSGASVLGFSLAGPDLREPLRLADNTLSRIR